MAAARVRSGGRPTLEEVAARAGVGRGTASRVINGSPRVSDATRQAVEAAVAELGYVPNRAARALAGNRTDAIALVVPEPETRFFAEPYFSAIVRGVGAALADTEMQLLLTLVGNDRERHAARPVPHRPPRRRGPPGRRARRRPAAGAPGTAGHALRDQRRPARGRDAALGRLRQLRGRAGRRRAPGLPGSPPGGHDHRPPGGLRGPAPPGRLPRGGLRHAAWPPTSASSPPPTSPRRAVRGPCATSWPAAPASTRSSSPPT